MLEKINNLKSWQIAVIFVLIGFAAFFTGLTNPFQNDDFLQIVNNTAVHSITNLPEFFGSSTFFNGEKLTGVYYRPLMTTTFSLIYSIFGTNTFAYHFVQLSLYIASAYILFLVFRHFFKKQTLALFLSLLFLIHHLNFQIVYSIPTMQDALFFFFGILAIWTLISHESNKSLWVVVAYLMLAMFSKESGVLFVIVTFLYLFWFDRDRIRTLFYRLVGPIILYLILRFNAVGMAGSSHAAPINNLDLVERLFTAPSVLFFYISKLVFPQQLSLGYYWVNPNFSVENVLFPLLIDIAVVGLFIFLGFRIRAKLPKKKLRIYLFFAAWTIIGLGLYMQVLPGLDFTACETWFYFTMVGLLGMIGISAQTVKIRFQPEWLIIPAMLLIVVLGVRSNLRGLDYSSQYKLAVHDLEVSSDNFAAMTNISQYYIDQGNFNEAALYAKRSIDIYPGFSNYTNLGVALQQTGDFKGAIDAYDKALKYGNVGIIYGNLALIHIVYSKPSDTEQFFKMALQEYPHDYKLWVYYAVFQGAVGSNDNAKTAIMNAAKYGNVPTAIYEGIMNHKSFSVPILGKTVLVR